jgi:5-methylcytosine-specific restriction protein A
MIREKFESIFGLYSEDKAKYKAAPSPKKLNDVPSATILQEILPDELKMACELGPKYEFKGSIGKGNMADIPHLCVFDNAITRTAQEGYYIVYLFAADQSKVYLSLNQGWTDYEHKFGIKSGKTRIQQNTRLAKNLLKKDISIPIDFSFEPIFLGTSDSLGLGYEFGNICSKVYERGKVPSDDTLIDDLKRLIRIYAELAQFVNLQILDIPYRKTEIEYQADIQFAKAKHLKEGPIPKNTRHRLGEREVWRRDPRIAIIALERAGYSCEIDRGHKTFEVRNASHLFMEGHHLIPVQFQDDFEHSLDVPENIISLCPNCHRAIHKAKANLQKDLIELFYKRRKQSLFKRGLYLELNELIYYYRSTFLDEDPDVE